MQTFVYIDNFRGFSDEFIPLRQVNFLVGENSTGKTSFIELVETLSNMPFWFFEPRYGVPGIQPRHFLDLVSASSKSKKHFSIGAIQIEEKKVAETFGMIVTYSNLDGRPVPCRVSVIQGNTIGTVDGKLWRSRKGEKFRTRRRECSLAESAANSPLACLRRFLAAHKSSVGFVDGEISEEFEGGPLFFRFHEVLFGVKDVDKREPQAPYPLMSDFVELAPIRTKPRRTYDAPQTEFSPEGAHTPYVIRRRLTSKTQAEAFRAFLEKAGQSSGLFQTIGVRSYGKSSQAPFEVRIVLGRTALGLENVGYGVSQALPVLVEMFVRPKHTAFTIQQPEVHLHPKAQATIGDLIAELARSDDKRFVVETHSDFAIDRFRLNIRKNGSIPSQLLFFERTATGNRAIPIPIQENGDLSAEQPEGYRSFFFNEALGLLS
jgi:hypothetical protein